MHRSWAGPIFWRLRVSGLTHRAERIAICAGYTGSILASPKERPVSMPVATYKCTACDFSRWDSMTWGYRYYLYGKVKVPMRVTIGWCLPCSDLVAIEVLPTARREAELHEQLAILRTELDEILSEYPRRRWWQHHATTNLKHAKLECEIKSVAERLAEYRLRRAALSVRISQARCLRCSSEDCASLPQHEAEYFNIESAPAPTGFMHPGCEGELVTVCEGTRLSLLLTEKAYDLEGGQLIDH